MTAEFFDQRRNSVSCRRWTVDYTSLSLYSVHLVTVNSVEVNCNTRHHQWVM